MSEGKVHKIHIFVLVPSLVSSGVMTSDLGVVPSLRQQPLVTLVKIKLCVVNQDYQTCLDPAQRNQDLSTYYQGILFKIFSL